MYQLEDIYASQILDDDEDNATSPTTFPKSLSLSHFQSGSKSEFFSEQSLNGRTTDSLENSPHTDEDEDEDQDMDMRSFEGFENKLKEGFLEASNLGLIFVPPAMFDYQPPLNRIDLKDNKIETLPEQFFDELPMLQWCDLRYNRLSSLPSLQVKHENLNVLLVQDNDLASLPLTLAYASNLHTIGWTNNDIENPPHHILLQGCKAILTYLRIQLEQRLPLDDKGNLIRLDGDEQLKKDLANTFKKALKKDSACRMSILSDKTENSSVLRQQEELRQKRLIDRIKYTWGLWQNVPYDGVSNQKLLEKSVQEVKDEVTLKLNRSKESILQKMRDNESLDKWRRDTRMLQVKGPPKSYEGVVIPFGTDLDDPVDDQGTKEKMKMDAETFRSTLVECMRKLQSFAETPAPLNDTEKSMKRLKEVEEIQRKLVDMKLKWTLKTSNPS